jgi:2-polyprenyl-3-methyl-5-hydroxy-6-metoxy-1,4-benzoquinol methylase
MADFDTDAVFGADYLHFYAPAFTQERNGREVAEIVRMLDLQPSMTVLDAPCGHGRISTELAVLGAAVTGLDLMEHFLAAARETAATRGVEVDYRRGDLRELPVEGPFDAVLCWFTSFGYFGDEDNRRVLREFHRVLRPGGRLLIETLHHDGFVRGFVAAPFASVDRVGEDLMIDESRFDSHTGCIETDRTVVRGGKVRTSHHSVRLLTIPEWRAWLTEAGFRDARFCGREGTELSVDSRRLVVTAAR